ncbi:MAG: HAD-IIB family hydrolase [Candidatus Electrothrix scaldis]|nr:MAG: HAD-IIB family hydrolase [Candidatus Electrothrix sp. GW3-3]
MKLLICTDLDRTLLPNGPQEESPEARPSFAALAKDPRVQTAYVTGRSIQLTEKAIKEFAIPFPDVLIADVGTTICHRIQGEWQHDKNWDTLLSKEWYQPNSPLPDLLRGIQGLTKQENEKQTRFKLSYYVDAGANQAKLTRSIHSFLEQEGIRASLIWSHDEVADQELLDILPARADKYQALQFMRHQFGYSLDEMIFSGDSGNDLEVLTSTIPAVLVANARKEVVDKALEMATAAGNESLLYLAQGGFQGMNGCYSAGILEGISHYYPEILQNTP